MVVHVDVSEYVRTTLENVENDTFYDKGIASGLGDADAAADLTLSNVAATVFQTKGVGVHFGLRFATVAAAQAETIPAAVLALTLSGRTSANDGGGNDWARVTSQPSHGGKFRSTDRYLPDGTTSSSNGGWWENVLNPRGVNIRSFDVVGNGAFNLTTRSTMTGADDSAEVQAGVDCGALYKRRPSYLSAGVYRMLDTLHIGYDGFNSVHFEGDGARFRCESGFTGTGLLCDFSDRPGINVQGARKTVLKGFALQGKNSDWIRTHKLGSSAPGDPTLDDLDFTSWIDDALNANADAQFTPCAAITVDGYSGVQPTPHYPVTTTTYGRAPSSDVTFEDIYIEGFVVGIAIQPANFDSNGDFITCRKLNTTYLSVVYTVGNTQGRVFDCSGGVSSYFHTFLNDHRYGTQQGEFGGEIRNYAIGKCIQVVDCQATAYTGPLTLKNLYCESGWRLGVWSGTGAGAEPLILEGCKLSLDNQNTTRGLPGYFLRTNTGTVRVVLRDTALINYKSVCAFDGDATGYEFDGVQFQTSNTRSASYEKFAHNATGGGMIFSVTAVAQRPAKFTGKMAAVFDLDAGSSEPSFIKDIVASNRAHPVCAWARWAEPSGDPGSILAIPSLIKGIGRASFSSIALSGGVLTLTFSSTRSDGSYMREGGLPGDVIFDPPTGCTFFVRSRTGDTLIAELQNDYKTVDGVKTILRNFGEPDFSTGHVSGTLYFINGRVYRTSSFLRGDLTSGSPIITNCGNDQGTATFIEDEIKVGDALLVSLNTDKTFTLDNAIVTARDNTAKTITLTGNAVYSQTRKTLGFWIRQGPANA